MIRLLHAEGSRLLARRFTLVILVGVLLALGAFQLVVNSALTPPSAAEVAAARAAFTAGHQQWQQDLQQCQSSGGSSADCAQNYPEPQLTDYVPSPASFVESVSTSLQVSTYLVALAVFMVGGSFVGAEFSSGAMANWLTYVPRRSQVFVSKLTIMVVFAAVAAAVAGALCIGAAAVLAGVHQVPVQGVPKLVSAAARGVLPAVLLAALGFCIGLVSRHTAAAIGVLLGYLFVWFVRSTFLSDLAWAARLTRWSPEGNVAAIVEHGHTYAVPVRTITPQGISYDYVDAHISYGQGLGYAAGLLVVAVLGSWLVFRRRDVS